MAGVTPTGFDVATYDEIVDAIETDLHANIDPALELGADTPAGQVIASFSDRLAEAWEALDIAYSAIDPRKAEGFQLDTVGVLRGVKRNPATKGTTDLDLDIDAGTVLPAGVIVAVAGEDGNQWALRESYGPAPGGVVGGITFDAVKTGVFTAAPNTITNIVTPVAGWNSATNPSAATPGAAAESDAAYRARQDLALASSGSGTVDAIRTAVLAVTGVQEAIVYENTATALANFDGVNVAPHSFAVMVYDGTSPAASNNAIAQAIWDNKPAGIYSNGSESGNAIGKDGVSRNINFYRAEFINIVITITVVTDPARFPIGGAAAVQARIVNYMSSILGLGDDVIPLQVQACVLETAGGVPGVVNVSAYTQSVSAINANQLALFTTGNVIVTVT